MKRVFYISAVTFLALILHSYIGHSQPNLPKEVADSLWSVWEDERQPDTSRLKAIYKYTWDGYLFTNPDSAFYFAQLQYEFAKKEGLKRQMADALNTQGVSFYVQGEHNKAIDYYSQSLKIKEEIGDKHGVANAQNNIGIVYYIQGDYTKAIDYYTRSLKIREEIGDKKGMANALNNIGALYKDQGNYAKAIDYYSRSLKIKEEIGDKKGIAATLNNIGIIYKSLGEKDKGINYQLRSLKIKEEIGDKKGIASTLNNIGINYHDEGNTTKALDYYTRGLNIFEEIGNKNRVAGILTNIGIIYKEMGDYDKALDYYTRSLKLNEETEVKRGIATSLNSLGTLYREQSDYKKALEYCTKALSIAQEVGSANEIMNASYSLCEIYKKLRRYEEALEMHELYINTLDSIQSEENQKEVIRQEYKYEYEKQAALDSVEYAKQQQLANATIAKQEAEAEKKDAEIRAKRNQQYALFGGLALLVIFGVFMYNRFRVTREQKNIIQKQKSEVELQKEVIEEAHKEITDSIQYAKRIQRAILPPKNVVKEYLPESFILYKPKDVVAGDFYWVESFARASDSEGTEDLILFAACDCTGHGVPGAMVSVVCNNGLNRSVREHDLTDPGQILNKTREIVIGEFEKSEEDVKDGMDIALCSLSLSTLTLKFSGANNPLWIIRKGAQEVEEVKGNKMPIGKFAKQTSFDTHKVPLQKGDSIYIFSDGLVDQFGGEKGKKFKPTNFKKLLLSNQQEQMERQGELIDETFENWRGNLEQLDDVCIIGIRV